MTRPFSTRFCGAGDLAGARPVFFTPWAGGTAYATAALPLADLIEANLDIGHLAALLAAPDVPEALQDSTPYQDVRRVPPGHALILRAGAREIAGYEPVASLAVAAPAADEAGALGGVRDALVEAVRARLRAPRHVPGTDIDPGPVPGMGPAERRAARGMPVPGIGADLSELRRTVEELDPGRHPGEAKRELLQRADRAARAADPRVIRVEASLHEELREILRDRRTIITLVVMPEECQSIPITAPNDWNQKGFDSRRNSSSRP